MLGEPLSPDILAGGSLILAGIALSIRGGRRRTADPMLLTPDAPPRAAN
jgi:O-acetylserine/cysteine efflux transporter